MPHCHHSSVSKLITINIKKSGLRTLLLFNTALSFFFFLQKKHPFRGPHSDDWVMVGTFRKKKLNLSYQLLLRVETAQVSHLPVEKAW